MANESEVRLWDVTSGKPTVISSLHAPFKITGAYADKRSVCRRVVVTSGKELILY